MPLLKLLNFRTNNISMSESIEQLKKRIAQLEEKLGLGDYDPSVKGYGVLVKIIKDQNSYLESINVKSLIVSEDKLKEFERAKGLWENLPKMIKAVNELKYELKIEPQEEKIIQKPISAKDIASGHVLPD